jgi:hypothetical protein
VRRCCVAPLVFVQSQTRLVGLGDGTADVAAPGIVYRPVRDATPVPVSLAWRKDNPPQHIAALTRLIKDAYSAQSEDAANRNR